MSERMLCVVTDIWLPASRDATQLGTCWPHQTSGQCKTLRDNSKDFEACCRGSQRAGAT